MSPAKSHVMLALQNLRERGERWVSIEILVEQTGLDREAVDDVMGDLEQVPQLQINRDPYYPGVAWTVDW